jgi:hypothetical protein
MMLRCERPSVSRKAQAAEVLAQLFAHPRHCFWTDDLAYTRNVTVLLVRGA